MMHARQNPLLPVLAVLFAGLAVAIACQVPVFRYALERWEADYYIVVVSPAAADAELTEPEADVVEFLKNAREDVKIQANILVRIDSEAKNDTGKARMDVFYPQQIRGIEVRPIWSGPLTMANAHNLVDSPARREIAKRILDGQSAVWLMVDSGNPEKDEPAAKAMSEHTLEAMSKLKIPDGVVTPDAAATEGFTDPDNVLRSDVPLKIDFSTLRIRRDDPAEEILLSMLLHVEDDLGEYAAEPMMFPAFGRGRVLEPLIGLGINLDNVLSASQYLCGACSCEVKDQNPGMDLVIAANWDAALEGSQVIVDKILPPLEGTAALIAAAPNAHKGSGSQGALLKPHFPDQSPGAEPAAVIADVLPPPSGADGPIAGLSPGVILGGVAGLALLAIGIGSIVLKRKGAA